MTLTQTVNITDSRRISLDVPREVPTGEMQIIVQFPVRKKTPAPQEVPQEPTRAERAYAAHLRARKDYEELMRKIETDETYKKTGFGCLKGKIWMADDFCEPLEDFKDYM